jgi:hypothetical protein
MKIIEIIYNLTGWLRSKGYQPVIEPTTPINVGQVAIFLNKADIEDAAYQNRYKFNALIELIFVEKSWEDCISKINTILSNITPSVLGEGVILSVNGIETREKEEGEPYYAMALLLSITYFGNEL